MKKNKVKVYSLSLLLILVIALIGYLISLLVGHNSRVVVRDIKIINRSTHYGELDEKSRKFISSNVYNINYTLKTSSSGYVNSIYGTGWSVYHDNESWYLMTNYHVVDKIVESSSWDYPGITKLESELPFLTKNTIDYGKFNFGYMDGGSEKVEPIVASANIGMQLTSANIIDSTTPNYASFTINKVTIIYDRYCENENPLLWKNDTNSTSLFAEVNGKTQYQTDMALIKVNYADISGLTLTPDPSTLEPEKALHPDPQNWIQQNTVNYGNLMQTEVASAKSPAAIDNEQSYYLGGYPVDKSVQSGISVNFADYLFESSNTNHVTLFKPSDSITYSSFGDLPSSFSNCWKTDEVFIEANSFQAYTDGTHISWPLFGGASGSPLFQLIKIATSNNVNANVQKPIYSINENQLPVAIFWGGTSFAESTDQPYNYFTPSVILFNSDLVVENIPVKYNIWSNIYRYLHWLN